MHAGMVVHSRFYILSVLPCAIHFFLPWLNHVAAFQIFVILKKATAALLSFYPAGNLTFVHQIGITLHNLQMTQHLIRDLAGALHSF